MGKGGRASWSGSLAFVIAAAASAIGLGNLWRFPYLAAQYGGGMFIAIYLVLVATLGFALMTTEIAIGRKTSQSQLTAYSRLKSGWGFIGIIGTIIPILIVPYYCVIGGWVLYYLKAYTHMAFTGVNIMGEAAADSGQVFSSFISAPFAPFGYGMVFILGCAAVIVMGVKNGIEKCVRRIEIFDTLIALIAGLMIIPVVYMFAVKTGTDVKQAMCAGPGLMFITLPKVFATLGTAGAWVGMGFFLLVVFAAATSAISLMEACVASVCDIMAIDRKPATFFTTAIIMFLATFSALGYGAWKHVKLYIFDTVNGQQFLDFFDFLSNSVLMPVVAVATCVFVGWVLGPKAIIDECESNGVTMKSKGIYSLMVKYIAPALMVMLLVSEICRALGIGGWSI